MLSQLAFEIIDVMFKVGGEATFVLKCSYLRAQVLVLQFELLKPRVVNSFSHPSGSAGDNTPPSNRLIKGIHAGRVLSGGREVSNETLTGISISLEVTKRRFCNCRLDNSGSRLGLKELSGRFRSSYRGPRLRLEALFLR